jgi:hypothetical protein
MRGADEKREDITGIRELLTRVFSSRNLLEPFDRIGTALEQVHNEKMGANE